MKLIFLMYVLQSLQGHLSIDQNFKYFLNILYFSLNIPNEFAFLMSQGINSHILGASEGMLSVLRYAILVLVIRISNGKLELVRRWRFPAFASKWFAENQRKSSSEAHCSLINTCSIFEEYVVGVLSPAYPVKLIFSRVLKKHTTNINIE